MTDNVHFRLEINDITLNFQLINKSPHRQVQPECPVTTPCLLKPFPPSSTVSPPSTQSCILSSVLQSHIWIESAADLSFAFLPQGTIGRMS